MIRLKSILHESTSEKAPYIKNLYGGTHNVTLAMKSEVEQTMTRILKTPVHMQQTAKDPSKSQSISFTNANESVFYNETEDGEAMEIRVKGRDKYYTFTNLGRPGAIIEINSFDRVWSYRAKLNSANEFIPGLDEIYVKKQSGAPITARYSIWTDENGWSELKPGSKPYIAVVTKVFKFKL
jgi:hypothetical protein